MGGSPYDINRNGICENDLNQWKSLVRFLGSEAPILRRQTRSDGGGKTLKLDTAVITGHMGVSILLLPKWGK